MDKTSGYILALNCGSSSLKFSLFLAATLKCSLRGSVTHIGQIDSVFEITGVEGGLIYSSNVTVGNITSAVQLAVEWFENYPEKYPVVAIGHRIVQGGLCHHEPEIIDDFLLTTLKQYIHLAPNHLPHEIAAIKLCEAAFPDVTQVACFDTGFHKDMPDHARYYPLPVRLREEGLVRYGYHGLSYEYVLGRLIKTEKEVKDKKIIIAHLGSGASMAAIKDGKSIETTMGFSPMGGLMMGSRPGDLDPAVVLFLLTKMKMSVDEVEDLFNKQSGLKALAGNGDVKELIEKEDFEPLAREALTMFCYQARKAIGSLAAALGGVDILVFTGGVGENSPAIRKRICKGLEFIGIHLNKKSNNKSAKAISSSASKVKVLVLKTDEDAMIALHTQNLLHLKSSLKY